MEASEKEIIRRVLAGDREEYRVLMERHFPVVLLMTLRITGNQQDAEEAAQEAFIRAYQQLPAFREQSAFGTWVFRIAMNNALNLVKRRNRNPEWQAESVDDPSGTSSPISTQLTPEAAVLDNEARTQRERAMEALTPMERTAFVLRHMEDQPMDVVADTLGTSANSARQTLFRAVSKLRRQLAPPRPSALPTSPFFKEVQ
ncbi:MAG TPA: RNA polymerase sigma factor [Terriglobus sp.]